MKRMLVVLTLIGLLFWCGISQAEPLDALKAKLTAIQQMDQYLGEENEHLAVILVQLRNRQALLQLRSKQLRQQMQETQAAIATEQKRLADEEAEAKEKEEGQPSGKKRRKK